MDDLDKELEKLRRVSSPLGRIYQPPDPKLPKVFGNMYEIGSCSRKLGYRYLGYESGPHSYPAWKSFTISRAGESFVKERLAHKGFKIIGKNKDVELMGFTGRIDGVIIKDKKLLLLECKTIQDSEKLERLIHNGVKKANKLYYSQIQAYLASISNVKACLLIILGSEEETWDDSRWHEEIVPADLNFQAYLQRKIQLLREKVERGELPFPEDDIDEKECEYCDYRHHCKEPERSSWQRASQRKGDQTHAHSANSESTVLSCENCKQKLRVPTNRGRIRIRCPKCGYKWEWEA